MIGWVSGWIDGWTDGLLTGWMGGLVGAEWMNASGLDLSICLGAKGSTSEARFQMLWVRK